MAEVYNTDRFAELYNASRAPQEVNLGLAARYMSSILSSYNIPFTVMGGWAVFLRGSGRQTQDVDIAVAASMDYLEAVLLAQPRICFPAIHGKTCVQIFVKTGRSFDPDYSKVRDLVVSMDIVISGNLGTPPDIVSTSDVIEPAVHTPQGSPAVVLGLYFQVSAKLTAFYDRGGQSTNDFEDLSFLIRSYGNQIFTFREILNVAHRIGFAQHYTNANAGNDARINYMRQVLGV